MPQPQSDLSPLDVSMLSPGAIAAQPNAGVSAADKAFPEIIGKLVEAVDTVTAAVSAKPTE